MSLLPNSRLSLIAVSRPALHRDVVSTILHSEQWRDALNNVTQSSRNVRVTPIRLLIKKYPDLAEEVFNMCTKTNGLEVGVHDRERTRRRRG